MKNLVASYQKQKSLSLGLTIRHRCGGSVELMGANASLETQVYHAASVGKMFTAVAIARLIEAKKINWDTPITYILQEQHLKNLFIWKGQELSSQVTVQMLLEHTSGLSDYFTDWGRSGKRVMDLILEDPDHLWTPQELLNFSREDQGLRAPPGKSFHYSDTNYLLLGFILEAIHKIPFHEVLRQEVFKLANMQDAYMPLREVPPSCNLKLRPTWLNGVELSQKRALSADWAGGGVALSAQDLINFFEALKTEKLIKSETLNYLLTFRHRFMFGIGYGLGFMELRPGEFSPLLKSLPKMVGHMGILAIQSFWEEWDRSFGFNG